MRQPGIYNNIDINDYHNDEGISSSGISLILDCPKRYWYEYISDKKRSKEEKSFEIGRAVHMMCLEQEKFIESFYIMDEEVDLRTKAGKELYAQAEHNAKGRTIIRKNDAEFIRSICKSISSHSLWGKIDLRKGSVEHSIYWDAGIYKTRLRSRPDFFNDNIIIDLKTTDSIASFRKSVYNFGYHRQAAMQIDGLKSIDGKDRHFAFFVVEKKAPFLTACFTLDENAIEQGRKEYLDGASIYSECLQFNTWPGYGDEFQLLSLPNWAVKKDDEEII